MTKTSVCSLVIPVYRNEDSLPELVAACESLRQSLSMKLEVVFVVDGSPDGSAAWLRKNLPAQRFSSQLCEHSRNFGSFAAIRTGLGIATGDYFAVMAADLQEPISLARSFFEKLENDEADVTIGVREGRNDPLSSSLGSQVFWWLYRRLVLPEIPEGGVDMFGCKRNVRDVLLSLHERNSSLVGQLFWVGFRRNFVGYERQVRKHGSSSWTFARKLRYLFDSVYSFSDLPIRFLKWLGASAMTLAGFSSVAILGARLAGLIEVPGYTATILTVIFFGGLNSLGLGVIGEYVWRTYENTKGRPLSIAAAHQRFGPAGAS
jgi:glycosyltransferase involved in cell wall biosynthesis